MTVSVTLSVPAVEVRLTKIEEPAASLAAPVEAQVALRPVEGPIITLAVAQPVVRLQPVLEPQPAQIVLSSPTQPAVQVVLGLQGPKGDQGPAGSGGGGGPADIRISQDGVQVVASVSELNFTTGLTVNENSDGVVDIVGSGGIGDATNIFERVNTDISGTWGATFYVQDATQGGDWVITRIDGNGDATTVSSDDSAGAGLTTAQAWSQRFALPYA